jgi:hypothetical protein
MAKRFIDTNIFRKSFMKGISVEAKLFYVYLFCECDHCGVWQVEFEVAKIRLGLVNLNEQVFLNYFADKIFIFDDGCKWFLPQFVTFQYGELKANNKIHKSVLSTLNKFSLIEAYELYQENKPFANPLQRVKDKDKDKEMDMDKEMDKEMDNSAQPISNDLGEVIELGGGCYAIRDKKSVKTAKNKEKKGAYQEFMQVYSEFLKKEGQVMRVTDADGRGLKAIIKYLQELSLKSGSEPIQMWNYILQNWNKLDKWQQTQVQLRQINSQLPNFIQTLKQNGKQTNNPASAQQLAEALRGVIQNGNSL